MPTRDPWTVAAAVALGVHAGFQLTVTAVVYPALAATSDADWRDAQARHSRRIGPVVGILYPAVLVTGTGALLTAPRPALGVAAGAFAGVLALTATRAAPLHGRLGPGRDPVLVRRLLRVDRWRSVGAVLALAAAVAAAV